MKKQEVIIGKKQSDGTMQPIIRSTVLQPKVQFKGGTVPWLDDTKFLKKEGASSSEQHI